MTKRLTFEEILNREFKWLREGDRPFVAGDPAVSLLTANEHHRLELMAEGYRIGADAMVDAALNDSDLAKRLVYPIVFNYRHFIELSMKRLIEEYGGYAGMDPEWSTHDLLELWKSLRPVLDHFRVPDTDVADGLIEQVVADFATADPGSFFYRYPFKRDGSATALTLGDFDLERLKDTMERAYNYFEACDAYWATQLPAVLWDAESTS